MARVEIGFDKGWLGTDKGHVCACIRGAGSQPAVCLDVSCAGHVCGRVVAAMHASLTPLPRNNRCSTDAAAHMHWTLTEPVALRMAAALQAVYLQACPPVSYWGSTLLGSPLSSMVPTPTPPPPYLLQEPPDLLVCFELPP